ncbi:MAG: dihydropyrimidinase [Anaerolineales bacterium]|nr:dihydropyrimidinase [Anaerolineales bacterium]
MYDLVIRNGLLITAEGALDADLGISDAQIAALGLGLHGKRFIDAAGCYVIPGGVDPHVHLQMPLAGLVSTDSFRSGSVAAACGGTTTFIDFVTPGAGEPLLAALAARKAEAQGEVAIDFGLHMTVPTWHATEEQRLLEVPEVVAAGCATFKMYQAYDGVMLDDVALLRALAAVADAGGRVVLHSETGPVIDVLRADALAEGHIEPIWHEYTRPAQLEATAIHRAAELADLTGCPLFIFHVGCAESIAEIVAAHDRGIDIHGETCPQYLLLSAEEHLGGAQGALFICAPPLRDPEDQEALWRALANDELQVVSTDHCPWTRAEKTRRDFAQVPGGVPGIEARLSLVHHFGVNRGLLSLERWVQVCSTNAASWMGLTTKGRLAPGYDADVVIFDPAREKTISPATLHEAAGWTPYNGFSVFGWPRTVLLRGQMIVENEEYIGAPGDGRFVKREA